ncbi:MAG: hypothetical protein AAGE99_05700 [Chlamydiota bacterium]
MSIKMQNIHTIDSKTSPKDKGSSLGLNLSAGMEAFVTAALSLLQQILTKINNQELEQSKGLAIATQKASQFSAKSTIEGGKAQFIEALSEGIGAIASGLFSVLTMAFGKIKNRTKSQLKQLSQEEKGIENTRQALAENARPSVSDVDIDGQQDVNRVANVHREPDADAAVKTKVEKLKAQRTFVDERGKALEVTGEDQDLMKAMTREEVTAVNEKLEENLNDLNKKKQSVIEQQARNQSTYATIGQSLGQTTQGVGKMVGATTKERQAECQASAQLAQSAVQGIQAILSQILKVANDALSQAQQAIQMFATISNGNRFQG